MGCSVSLLGAVGADAGGTALLGAWAGVGVSGFWTIQTSGAVSFVGFMM